MQFSVFCLLPYAFRSLVQEAPTKAFVSVHSPVAEERPVSSHILNALRIDLGQQDFFVVC
jgi:hypothetical protein